MSDPRFARLKSDPRFRKPKRARNKVVVDQRFKSLLGEEEGSADGKGKAREKVQVDKYGRKVSKSRDKDNLRRFYRLDEDETESAKPAGPVVDYARGEALMESSSEEEDSEESDDSSAEEVVIGRQVSQPSTSKGKKAGELLDVDLDESTFAELDAQAKAYSTAVPESDNSTSATKPTSRIAAVNLDWDHVTAAHLFRVTTSVLPSGGSAKVLRVAVYPSDFGRERMEREEREGPPKELFKKGRGARADEVDSDEDVNEQTIFTTQEGDDYDDDALRQYQLDRLRYYYAVITCNSPSAASHIYNELEGTELERSANVFDLSYVPEDMEFTQDSRDECTSEAQAPTKGMDFVTDALRHSKVKLTWDDDNPERNKITRRRMTRKEVEEGDFRALLASSSSEDEDDSSGEADRSKVKDREKMRALLLGGNDDDLPEGWGDDNGKDKSADLEITFMPALSSNAPKDEEDETTLDRYKRKQKEKREQRKTRKEVSTKEAEAASEDEFFGEEDDDRARSGSSKSSKAAKVKNPKPSDSSTTPHDASTDAELALLLAPDPGVATNAEPKHFDMRAVVKAEKANRAGKKGRRRDKKGSSATEEAEDGKGFQIDVKDERFAALHEDHVFAIDPSNPHFQNTKAMQALLDERAKRQRDRQSREETQAREKIKAVRESTSDDRSLKSIVESVKRKSSVARSGAGKRQRV